ncbi:hypothetical protein DSECCO2_121470 [anaerobic digester metagenome]
MQTLILILSVFTPILISLFVYAVYIKIKGSIEHGYNKQTEELKGEISKNNALLTSSAQNYFSSSEKLIDKKIEAYWILWEKVQVIKDHIIPEMGIIYNILTNEEIDDPHTFKKIGQESNIVQYMELRTNIAIKPICDASKKVALHRPFISDQAFTLFIVLQIFVSRLRYKFIESYINREIYNWKKDKATVGVLRASLKENEINHIMNIDVYSLRTLIEIIEHKIIQTTKRDLNINHTAEDAVQYVRKMEELFKGVNKNLKNS